MGPDMGESATTIYLIRHGRTTLNAQGRFRGRQDPPLDAVGRDQASSAAKLLSGIRLAVVYSSPLTRAVQTAETVGASCELDVVIEPELIDLDYGMWEGLTEEEAELVGPSELEVFKKDLPAAIAPKGETLAGVERRVMEALLAIGQRHTGQATAAVSHDVPIMLVVAKLSGISGPAIWAQARVATGSITTLRLEAAKLGLASEPGEGP